MPAPYVTCFSVSYMSLVLWCPAHGALRAYINLTPLCHCGTTSFGAVWLSGTYYRMLLITRSMCLRSCSSLRARVRLPCHEWVGGSWLRPQLTIQCTCDVITRLAQVLVLDWLLVHCVKLIFFLAKEVKLSLA